MAGAYTPAGSGAGLSGSLVELTTAEHAHTGRGEAVPRLFPPAPQDGVKRKERQDMPPSILAHSLLPISVTL